MIFAFIACICWSIAIFPVTEAIKRIGHAPVNFFRHLLGFILFTLVIITFKFNYYHRVIDENKLPTVLLIISGILGLVLSDLLRLRSLNTLGIKTVSIYSSFQPVLSLVFGYAFLNEKHNYVGILGLIAVCSGLLLYFLSKKEKAEIIKAGYSFHSKDLFVLLACMVFQALAIVFSKKAIVLLNNRFEAYEIAYTRIIGAVVVMFIYAIMNGKLIQWLNDFRNNKNNANKYFIASTTLGNVIAVSCSIYALSILDSVVAQSIFSLIPFFILPLNFIINKEKITYTTFISFVISISGVYLILWEKTIINKFN